MELGNIYSKHRSIVYYSSVNKKTILISLPSCAVTFEASTVTGFNKVFWVVSRLKLLMLDTLTASKNFTYEFSVQTARL